MGFDGGFGRWSINPKLVLRLVILHDRQNPAVIAACLSPCISELYGEPIDLNIVSPRLLLDSFDYHTENLCYKLIRATCGLLLTLSDSV